MLLPFLIFFWNGKANAEQVKQIFNFIYFRVTLKNKSLFYFMQYSYNLDTDMLYVLKKTI